MMGDEAIMKKRKPQAEQAAKIAKTSEKTELDARLEAMIGAKLRRYYDDLLSEPVPDRFMDLLLQLDAKERQRDDETGNAA